MGSKFFLAGYTWLIMRPTKEGFENETTRYDSRKDRRSIMR